MPEPTEREPTELEKLISTLQRDTSISKELYEARVAKFMQKIDWIGRLGKAYSRKHWHEWEEMLNDPFGPWDQDMEYNRQLITDDIKDFFKDYNRSNWWIQYERPDGGRKLLRRIVVKWLLEWSNFVPNKVWKPHLTPTERADWLKALRIIREELERRSDSITLNWIKLWDLAHYRVQV